jgi:hypothetical protein
MYTVLMAKPQIAAKTTLAKLIGRYGGRCYWCKCEINEKNGTRDHLYSRYIPARKEGQIIVASCGNCNTMRSKIELHLLKAAAKGHSIGAIVLWNKVKNKTKVVHPIEDANLLQLFKPKSIARVARSRRVFAVQSSFRSCSIAVEQAAQTS